MSSWKDAGEIRLQCRKCGKQHDEIAAVPPGWTQMQRVRSFERATTEVQDGHTANAYGDTAWDWQTHFGTCQDCTAKE